MLIDPIIVDGYLLIFIYPHVQHFCPLCQNVLQDPVQFVRSGHRFCMRCIFQQPNTITLYPGFCHMCGTDGILLHSNCVRVASRTATRDLLNRGDIFHDRGVMREINQLQVWCIVCGRTFLYGQRMERDKKRHKLSMCPR